MLLKIETDEGVFGWGERPLPLPGLGVDIDIDEERVIEANKNAPTGATRSGATPTPTSPNGRPRTLRAAAPMTGAVVAVPVAAAPDRAARHGQCLRRQPA